MALDQLKSLATAVPGINQQAQKRASAAADVSLQQGLAAVPRPANVRRVAQQAAAQQVGIQGDIAAQGMQQQQQQLLQIGQQGLQQQGFANQQYLAQKEMNQNKELQAQQRLMETRLTESEIASRKKITDEDIATQKRLASIGLEYDSQLSLLSNQQQKDLAKLNRDVKREIFDSRITFEQDERGRKFSNERQLADYVALSARSEMEARRKLQMMGQNSQRHIQLLHQSYNVMNRALERSYKSQQARLDFETQKEIMRLKQAMLERIKREQARSANRAALGTAIVSTAQLAAGVGMMYVGGMTGNAMMVGGGASVAAGGAQGLGTAYSQSQQKG